MSITELLRQVTGKTTDTAGNVGTFAVHTGKGVEGYLEAKLDSSRQTVADWRIKWTAHWRDGDKMAAETSADLPQLLARFGHVDLVPTQPSNPAAFFAKN